MPPRSTTRERRATALRECCLKFRVAPATRRAALALAASAALVLAGASTHVDAAAAAAGRQAAPAGAPGPGSAEWPQTIQAGGRTYLVYAPAFERFSGDSVAMTQAISRAGPEGTAPEAGSMEVTADSAPGADDGELELSGFRIGRLAFAGTDAVQAEVDAIQAAIGGKAIQVTRRALLHDMQLENARAAGTPGLGDFVPAFRVERRRAVLVSIDGDPSWVPLGATGWRKAVNTPFLVLQSQDGSFVLRLGPSRWVGSAELGGGYAPVEAPPGPVIDAIGTAPPPPLPAGQAGAGAAGAAGFAPAADAGTLPEVVVCTEPTVLVSMNGEPVLADVAPGVRWAANARCMLLQTADPSAWWTLAAGRWFRTPSLDGPWSRIRPADVPAAFALLPGGRAFDAAKASVPRTPEAVAAVAAAGERRSMRVSRATARCGVAWKGNPMWGAVPGTLLRAALNASQPVVECDRSYFCCDNGAWFRADAPEGPWFACDSLPDAIDTIPASSPLYPVTGVDVAGATESDVTFTWTPAYLGTCIDDGTVAFGTGWDVRGTPLPDGGWVAQPGTFSLPVVFDADTGTFAPDAADADQDVQPALDPEVLVVGWAGWGWCPGWTSAWGWGWRSPAWWDDWGEWWRNWNPCWNRWANARVAEQRARDARAAEDRAARDAADARRDAEEEARRAMTAQESAWRARRSEERAREDASAARAEAARFRDMRDAARREADAREREALARSGPVAARGSLQWWYQYANDYSHGYLSRATGYRDPRYARGVPPAAAR